MNRKKLLNEWTKIAFMLIAIAVINLITTDYIGQDYNLNNERARQEITTKIDSINQSIWSIQSTLPTDLTKEIEQRKDSIIYIYRTHETINNNYPIFTPNDSADFADDLQRIRSAKYRPYQGID